MAGTATSAHDLAINAVEQLKRVKVELARIQAARPPSVQCDLSHTDSPTAQLIDLAGKDQAVAPTPRERVLVPKVLETSRIFSVPPRGLSSPVRQPCSGNGMD